MRNLSDRIMKLEVSLGAGRLARRVLQHVVDCAPADRPSQLAALEASDPNAFHIVRVVVRPGDARVA